ncbi:hypothetical protein CPB84DRAFT_1847715 [Gymnopilus junonius]|uniref:F-box domain-containing protein n=1 Tax=Gymnopilus junonius TaxID=109634 RepID=A0A9P5NJR1_GYMJU|nr:hypothetical protein CPB84DRAFT_1847715 [Gymnopilus junonius]
MQDTSIINSKMPIGVFTLIFKEVHAAQVADFNARGVDVSLGVVRSPTFFPYSLAAVCQRWEDILSNTAEFWKHVLLFLDMVGGTNVKKARAYLEWSKEFPICVFVTRGRQGSAVATLEQVEAFESKTVSLFMEALMQKPHFLRCHVDATVSTAPPLLPRYLPVEASLLRRLSLQCVVERNIWDPDTDEHIFQQPVLDFANIPLDKPLFEFKPRLTHLTIDGRNIYYMFNYNDSWEFEIPDLRWLKISHYNPIDCSKPYHPYKRKCGASRMWRFLSLIHLTLHSVWFTIDDDEEHEGAEYDLFGLESLTMIEMDADIMCEFFRVVQDKTLTFSGCQGLNDIYIDKCQSNLKLVDDSFYNPTLQLLNIQDPSFDLVDFVKCWRCDTLTIAHCSTFSDAFFEAVIVQNGKGRSYFSWGDCLTQLYLHFPDVHPVVERHTFFLS